MSFSGMEDFPMDPYNQFPFPNRNPNRKRKASRFDVNVDINKMSDREFMKNVLRGFKGKQVSFSE